MTRRLALVLLAAISWRNALFAQDSAPPSGAATRFEGTCVPGREYDVGSVSGRRIVAVDVVPSGPSPMTGIGTPLHVTTRDVTVRDRLLFAAGDSVDTLRVAESVRQLRRLRFLVGAVVTARCASPDSVILTVATRDAWSIRGKLSARGSSPAVAGLEESNLFGTGRAARAYVASDHGQLSVGAGYSDPTLFRARAVGTLNHDTYSNGGAWGVALRTAEQGVYERRGWAFTARRSVRQTVPLSAGSSGDTVQRATASILMTTRVRHSPLGATFLVTGIEAERTALAASASLPIAGPPSVRRTFAGLDVGVVQRTGRYRLVPWLLPETTDGIARFAPAEIPAGLEAEALVSGGRDFAARRPASHADMWAGRVWGLGSHRTTSTDVPRALLSTDLWASGYRGLGLHSAWSAGSVRGAIGFVAPASRGLWSARVSAEALMDPDPDVRGLAMSDRALRAIPPGSRLAESAFSGSLERSVRLLGARHGYVLEGVVFGAGSVRWDAAAPLSLALRSPGAEGASTLNAERIYVGSAGLGLLLRPTRFGHATLRLDVGMPVVGSSTVRRGPYVGISITPAFGTGRRRDGNSAP